MCIYIIHYTAVIYIGLSLLRNTDKLSFSSTFGNISLAVGVATVLCVGCIQWTSIIFSNDSSPIYDGNSTTTSDANALEYEYTLADFSKLPEVRFPILDGCPHALGTTQPRGSR